jgi:peptidoglycan/LPS O-acetylase OafA/YrhL
MGTRTMISGGLLQGAGLRIVDRAAGRQNNYDWLRFVAASLVIVSHAYYVSLGETKASATEPLRILTRGHMSFGDLGLAVFFVISGFLVTQSYDRRHGLLVYLKARALRIFPALAVVLLAAVFVLGPLVTTRSLGAYFHAGETYSYLASVALVRIRYVLPGVFAHNAYPLVVNAPLWTLHWEFLFYLVVGGLGVLGLLRRWGRLLVVAVVALCVIAPLTNAVWDALHVGASGPRLFASFGMGMLLYLYRERLPLDGRFAALALAVLVVCARLGGYDTAFPLAGAYLIVYASYAPWLRLWSWGRFGDFSYGLYIFAFPVQQVVVQALGGHCTVSADLALAYPTTLVLAVLSWHLVERRCLALKDVRLGDVVRGRRMRAT